MTRRRRWWQDIRSQRRGLQFAQYLSVRYQMLQDAIKVHGYPDVVMEAVLQSLYLDHSHLVDIDRAKQ
jgi:hypothetical protein